MDPDADLLFPPTMTTAEMLKSFETDMEGSMQDTDNFFSSALAADASERLFADDGLNNPLFQSPQTTKMQATPANSFHNQIHASTSPESSVQDSSSDSSVHRKRKSSSKSSRSGLWNGESPMSNTLGHIKRESTNSDVAEFNNRVSGDLFDFDSAGSSPSKDVISNNTLGLLPEITSNSTTCRHVAIQYQDSPISTTSFMNNATTRETSPMSNSVKSETRANPNQSSRPSPFASHEEYLDTSLLKGMEQRSWPFGEDTTKLPAAHLPSAIAPTNLNNRRSLLESGNIYQTPTGPTLLIHPTPQKSRVETQIPIKMTIFPLPKGVKKLHLPSHTISKPKLLIKPPPTSSADTLELHTMLVCTSAMQDPMKLRNAFLRAAGLLMPSNEEKRRLSAGERMDKDDEDHPLNGGEVRICEGCIVSQIYGVP